VNDFNFKFKPVIILCAHVQEPSACRLGGLCPKPLFELCPDYWGHGNFQPPCSRSSPSCIKWQWVSLV